jgi:N4-gp56 family major capsid protein
MGSHVDYITKESDSLMENLFILDLKTFDIQTTANINTGTGALATKPQAFYDRVLLELRRQRTFYHKNLAQQRPMPKRSGDTVNFRKITALAVSTTPLTEGVTPTGDTASISAISATTAQYGKFIEFSDVVDFQQVDDVLAEYTKEQGHQANETLDVLTRDVLAAGSSVYYAGGATSRNTLDTGHIPTIEDFRKIVLQMKKDHVRPALAGKYVAIISPEVAFDLMVDPLFKEMMEFGHTNKPMMENEIGDLYGIKFIEQVNAKTFERLDPDTTGPLTDITVHASVVLGNQAYGTTTVKGEGDIKSIVKPLGSAGTTDPLNQRQTIGWKVNAFVAKRLDETAIARYESVPTQA